MFNGAAPSQAHFGCGCLGVNIYPYPCVAPSLSLPYADDLAGISICLCLSCYLLPSVMMTSALCLEKRNGGVVRWICVFSLDPSFLCLFVPRISCHVSPAPIQAAVCAAAIHAIMSHLRYISSPAPVVPLYVCPLFFLGGACSTCPMVSLQTTISICRHSCVVPRRAGQPATLQKVHTDLAGLLCSQPLTLHRLCVQRWASNTCPDALIRRLSEVLGQARAHEMNSSHRHRRSRVRLYAQTVCIGAMQASGGGGARCRFHCGVDHPTGNDVQREPAHQDRNTRISW